MRTRVGLALVCALGLAVAPGINAYAKSKRADQARQFQKPLTGDEKILQALNRMTSGPRAGDLREVKSVGLKKWIDRQLHPENVVENPVLEEKLKTLDTLTDRKSTRLNSSHLVISYAV